MFFILCHRSFITYPFPKQALVFMWLQYKSFENTVGKGKIARNEQFLLFPQCFLPTWRILRHLSEIQNCRLHTLSVWKSKKSVVWERVKSLQKKPIFYAFTKQALVLNVCNTSLLKTRWEKEKLLIMSNFSFSLSISFHLDHFLQFTSNLKLLSADSFSLEESKICHLRKG